MWQKDALTLVAFGDSITAAMEVTEDARWPSLVETWLREQLPTARVTVINAGVGGNTSREGLARIEESVLSHAPDIVLVEFGGNDVTETPERYVSPEEFTDNLIAMKARICDGTGAAMFLLVFPPVVNAWHVTGSHPFHLPFGGLDEHVEQYRQLTRAFAETHGLPQIDLSHLLRDAYEHGGEACYTQPDGVHLTNHGNAVVATAVINALQRWLSCVNA